MLVNLAKIVKPAAESGYAVACFNVFGWEDAIAANNEVEGFNLTVAQHQPITLRTLPDLVDLAAPSDRVRGERREQ